MRSSAFQRFRSGTACDLRPSLPTAAPLPEPDVSGAGGQSRALDWLHEACLPLWEKIASLGGFDADTNVFIKAVVLAPEFLATIPIVAKRVASLAKLYTKAAPAAPTGGGAAGGSG